MNEIEIFLFWFSNLPKTTQAFWIIVFLVIAWIILGIFFRPKTHEFKQKIRVWGDPDIRHLGFPYNR